MKNVWQKCGLILVVVTVAGLLCWFPALSSALRNHQLVNAIKAGETDRVTDLLQQGADPNTEVCIGYAPPEGLRWLSSFVAPTWLPKQCGCTAPVLVFAVDKRLADIAVTLVKYKANTNACNGYSQSALQTAVSNNNEFAAQLLLEHNADPNANTGFPLVPLFGAIEQNNLPMLRLLVQHGAKLQPNEHGSTPLQQAVGCGNIATIQWLLNKGVDVNERDKQGGTALMEAALDGRKNIVYLLLTHGAKRKVRNHRGESALNFALYANTNRRNQNVVDLLQQALKKPK